MESMKNIKTPKYALELGKGRFVAWDDDEYCPRCGHHVYFDAGNGWYQCEEFDWHSRRMY